MPLSDPQLLSLLTQQKLHDAQEKHARGIQEAHHKAAGNLNAAAHPAAIAEAHKTSMLEFGRALLSAWQEAFETEGTVPDEADEAEILKRIGECLKTRLDVARSDLDRMERATGYGFIHSHLSPLSLASAGAFTHLKRETQIWRRKRLLTRKPPQPAGSSPATVHVTVSGDHNQVAVAGGNQGPVAQTKAAEPLSAEAQELLRAAAKDGELFVAETDQTGKWIRVERRDFFDAADPAVAARFLDALDLLCRLGVARHSDGKLFALTGQGFEKARSLGRGTEAFARSSPPTPQPVPESGTPELDFDVALSFASPQRATVEEFAGLLKARGLRVFYDKDHTAALWGRDLTESLDEIYRKRSRQCVPFVSRAYAEKTWPRHELRSARARALEEKDAYILPIRVEADVDLPGLPPTIAYVSLSDYSLEQIADLLARKLDKAS